MAHAQLSQKTRQLDKVKWCIWNGKSKEGIDRFSDIIASTRSKIMKKRLTNLQNNEDCLINYAERHKQGMLISSQGVLMKII